MSVVSNDILKLPMPGMSLAPLTAGSEGSLYIQNLRFQSGRWGTRGGFGLLTANTSVPWGGDRSGQLNILGVTTFTTDSGQQYLLALGYQQCDTSQLLTTAGGASPRENLRAPVWVLNLYGLQAGAFMQQTILTRRASQDARPLYQVLPNRSAGGFELNPSGASATMTWSQDNYAPLSVRNPQLPVSFAQAGDRIIVCHPDIGLWLVEPGLTAGDHAGIDSMSGRDCQTGFGESAWARPLVIRSGVFDRDYATQDEIGTPDLIATYQGRTVLAKGRALSFSDASDPAAYAEINITSIGTDQTIRALLPVRNGILVLTQSEVFLYVPSEGDPVSAGSTTLLSTSTGIIASGPQAATSVLESACWVSTRGVHVYGGGSEIQTIMGPVANLFDDTYASGPVPNPVSNYPVRTGTAPVSTTTDQTAPLQQLDLSLTCLSYEPRTRELYLSSPRSNRVLVHAFPEPGTSESATAWWTFETQVTTTPTPTVATTATIPGMRVLGAPTSGGTLTYGIDQDGNVYVLGRGGALDASSHPAEDHAQGKNALSWRQETAVAPPSAGNIAAFYFGPAYRLPTGFKTSTQTTTQDVWEARVYVQVPDETLTGDLINRLEVYLTLTSNWRFLCEPATAELDLTFGPTFQTIYDGFTQVQATNLGGIPDPNGIQARIVWATPGPATWTTHPDPGLNPHAMYEVCRLRLRRNNPSTTDTTPVSTYVDQVPVAEISTNAPVTYSARVYYGAALDRQGSQAFGHDARDLPVDWAYHTPVVGDGNTTMKLRGLWVKSRRSGMATSSISSQWPFGPYNWLYASNDRDLSAREYSEPDLPGNPAGIGTGQVRSGAIPNIPNLLNGDVAEQVWGGTSTCWGPSGPVVPPLPRGATQVPLVGSTPVGQWACTSGGRGETARWLLFGYLRGRAEYIQFGEGQPLTVITRPQAARKRRGGQ